MFRLIFLISLILTFSLNSCGKKSETTFDSFNTLNSEILLPVLTFEDACKTYNLVCDTSDFGTEFTGNMWTDLTALLDKFLNGKTSVQITRAQYDTGEVQNILNSLELSHISAPVEAFLKTFDWKLITVGLNGAITIHINNPGYEHVFDTNLSLIVPGNSFSMKINGDLVTISGLSLAFPDSEPREFNSMRWVEKEGFLVITNSEEINSVPLHFLFGHVSMVEVPEFDKTDIPLVIDQARAGIDFAYKLNPILDIQKDFMLLLSSIIDKYNETPKLFNVTDLLSNIVSATNVPGTREIKATLKSGIRYVKCRIEQPKTAVIAMDFRKKFGVKTIKTDTPGALTLELYDIRASVDVYGPIDPGFSLKNIRIDATGITILDVPVIKKFTLKWDDLIKENSEVSFICKKR